MIILTLCTNWAELTKSYAVCKICTKPYVFKISVYIHMCLASQILFSKFHGTSMKIYSAEWVFVGRALFDHCFLLQSYQFSQPSTFWLRMSNLLKVFYPPFRQPILHYYSWSSLQFSSFVFYLLFFLLALVCPLRMLLTITFVLFSLRWIPYLLLAALTLSISSCSSFSLVASNTMFATFYKWPSKDLFNSIWAVWMCQRASYSSDHLNEQCSRMAVLYKWNLVHCWKMGMRNASS